MQKNNSFCKKSISTYETFCDKRKQLSLLKLLSVAKILKKKNKKKRDCLNCNHAYLHYTLYIDKKNLFRKIKILLTDQMTIYK